MKISLEMVYEAMMIHVFCVDNKYYPTSVYMDDMGAVHIEGDIEFTVRGEASVDNLGIVTVSYDHGDDQEVILETHNIEFYTRFNPFTYSLKDNDQHVSY